MTAEDWALFAHETTRVVRVAAPSALEVDFPAAMLSEVGLKESWRKEVHRPATSTHKWWAKRLGTVFRGIMVSAVSRDSEEAVDAYGDATSLNGLVILDPFAGSGTTAVEALKLGAKMVSLDINPVATLVQRQAVQPWDWRLIEVLCDKVERVCRAEIDRVHRTEDGRTVLYYFWVADAQCPSCGERVHLFDTPVYARNAYPKRVPRAQIVCPQCLDLQQDRYDFVSLVCANDHKLTQDGNVRRSSMTCSRGHTHRIIDALEGFKATYSLYAKMVAGPKGSRSYEPITGWDRALFRECEERLVRLPADNVMPVGSLASGNNTDQALRWNFRAWQDFFNARQLYSLSLLATAIRDLDGEGPEREALCALFSGTLEFNNLFTSFKGEGTGAVRHMFSHHILKPERTPLEAHPWGTPQSSGSFSTLLKSRLRRADEYKKRPVDLVLSAGEVRRVGGISQPIETDVIDEWGGLSSRSAGALIATMDGAVTSLPAESVDLVISDPPYMDNVHYAELADFFHSWLREMRPYPAYPTSATTRNDGEVQDADPVSFGRAIEGVWTECARLLKPSGLLAFTFHQARIAGWVELVKALRAAGLTVTAVQPVKGEMATSIVKAGAREPSNLDSVVVCRKSSATGPTAHRTLRHAYDAAEANLRRLQESGVTVGAGDVRSVMRGTLLAHICAETDDLASRASEVDALADRAIGELCGPVLDHLRSSNEEASAHSKGESG